MRSFAIFSLFALTELKTVSSVGYVLVDDYTPPQPTVDPTTNPSKMYTPSPTERYIDVFIYKLQHKPKIMIKTIYDIRAKGMNVCFM